MEAYGLALHMNSSQTYPFHLRSKNCGHIGDFLEEGFKGSACHPIDYSGRQVAVWAVETVGRAADSLLWCSTTF